jgi:hypothetical protein
MRWLVLYRHEDADPATDLSPPLPCPHSARPPLCSAPPPPAAATAPAPPPLPPPPRSHVLRHQRCPPPPPPAVSCSPPEKMRCEEVSNFMLEKWYENEKVTSSLCERVNEPINDGSMCLIISARRLLAVLQP